ncbi:restriction endonuclease subunit S [uncultured Phocaeicola sp.]|jgi:type I restriction enzyme S subunit|uniref:restriction endonuclease subunit S n=2 Tax=uncultured Phocaeicola sp. TaxID=990718 RepID=UPI0025A1E870|nr:restriction endonuclease subunit S [uncultured Phocaeicola sp.]
MYDVPHLRFPEFSGEWEKYRLCDVASIVGRIGFRGYTTNDIVTKGKGAIALSPTNIENNKLTYDKDNTYISFYKYEESPEIMIKQGDVIFVKTGSTVGKVAYVDKLICKTTLNPQVVVLKDIQCDNYLLSVLMSTNKFQNAIRKIIVGGAVPTLSQAAMGDIVVTMPQATEQEKLSKFISLLDDRIATQNKIIEKLQSLIKGLAAQLTQSGTPNVRLCDCLECHSSTLQENCVSATGSYPVYGATGLIGYTNGYAYNGESILIVKDGSGVGSLSYANDCYSVIGTLNYLTAKGKYSVLYLYYALMAFNFTPYITGMAIPHIYFKDYGKAKVFCPSIENQIRIASLLHNIEQKLVVEQNLIISLSAQKSYLLRMLFI